MCKDWSAALLSDRCNCSDEGLHAARDDDDHDESETVGRVVSHKNQSLIQMNSRTLNFALFYWTHQRIYSVKICYVWPLTYMARTQNNTVFFLMWNEAPSLDQTCQSGIYLQLPWKGQDHQVKRTMIPVTILLTDWCVWGYAPTTENGSSDRSIDSIWTHHEAGNLAI